MLPRQLDAYFCEIINCLLMSCIFGLPRNSYNVTLMQSQHAHADGCTCFFTAMKILYLYDLDPTHLVIIVVLI